MENNIIYEKSVAFSVLLLQRLQMIQAPSYRVLVQQLTRSGTAIGASIAEADSAESLLDFLHKMRIADKELKETSYWLSLLEAEFPKTVEELRPPLNEVQRILRSIIITCTNRVKERKRIKS